MKYIKNVFSKKGFIVLLMMLPMFFFSACHSTERCFVRPNIKSSVRIAVIDTGVSKSVVSEEAILEGYNYVNNNTDTEDKVGHGTAVCNLIIGHECEKIQIVPLVYATSDASGKQVTGDVEMVAAGVYDAVDKFQCDIICIPAGTTEDNDKLHEAVRYAKENNVLVISCAGNYELKSPGTRFYPGAYEEVICVGSCNEFGEESSFSQSGEYVDILALGEDLAIATLKDTNIRGEGTSYSVAIAASKAAAILLDNQGIGLDELCEKLIEISPICVQ